MSFIDDSEKNIDRLMETTAGGGVAGFVGRAGMGIDDLFAGSFHPDSGHGSENEKLLQKQIDDRKKKRKDMEQQAYEDGVELVGNPDPIGGHFSNIGETEFITLAFDELIRFNDINKQYNDENTPPAETEWKSTGWDYDYDKPGSAYKVRDIKYDEPGTPYKVRDIEYDDNSNLYKTTLSNIKYDDNSNLYADDTYINKSATNWEYIEGENK